MKNICKERPKDLQSVLVWADVDGEHMWTPAWLLDDYPNEWHMSGWIEGEDVLSIGLAQWWMPMPEGPETFV